MTRTLAVRTGGMLLILALATGASAQEGSNAPTLNLRHLGGSTAFYKPSLLNVGSLNRMGSDPRVVTNVRTVLGQGGVPDLTDRIVGVMAGATTVVRGGFCSDATPAEGTVVECDVQPGQTMLWMAYRPTGGARLGLLNNVRWAGPRPFAAYLFRVTADGRTYTFLLPKICGNLTLVAINDVPRVAVVEPPPPPAPVVMPPPPPPPPVVVEAPPPPPPPPPPPAPPAAVVRPVPFFFDVLGGKDRRVRPIGGRTTVGGSQVVSNVGTANTDFAQCSPLVGIKVGMAKRFDSDWELAGAAGIAISLVRADHKVRQHEVLVDVEANRYLGGGAFLGTGLSLWDVTHSDTFTPAWMVHVGLPLGSHPRHPLYLLTEGRLFFDHLGDARNNYQVWAGVRVHL